MLRSCGEAYEVPVCYWLEGICWRFVKDCMHAGILFFRNTGLLGKSGNFVVVHMPSVGFMYSKAVKKTG